MKIIDQQTGKEIRARGDLEEHHRERPRAAITGPPPPARAELSTATPNSQASEGLLGALFACRPTPVVGPSYRCVEGQIWDRHAIQAGPDATTPPL